MFELIILAIIQGITEWFPVSSSGHLLVFERILGLSGGLTLEVALHLGTLLSVFVYFRKDLVEIMKSVLSGDKKNPNFRIFLLLIIASVPAGIVGFFLKDLFDLIFSNLLIVGIGFGITGLSLFLVSNLKNKPKVTSPSSLSFIHAFIIGLAQSIAIVPGISRSGSTISSAIFLGIDEKSAMKFSFLLSIPVIFGASIFVLGDTVLTTDYILPTFVSFLVGLFSIHFVFTNGLNQRKNFFWFGLYTLLLSLTVILYFFLSR